MGLDAAHADHRGASPGAVIYDLDRVVVRTPGPVVGEVLPDLLHCIAAHVARSCVKYVTTTSASVDVGDQHRNEIVLERVVRDLPVGKIAGEERTRVRGPSGSLRGEDREE